VLQAVFRWFVVDCGKRSLCGTRGRLSLADITPGAIKCVGCVGEAFGCGRLAADGSAVVVHACVE
jgi:hypothetical protein